MFQKNPALKYLLLSAVLILIDQATKFLVHFNMEPGFPGQIVLLGDWLKLHYVLNPGMAFGMQLGHEYGKLFLTLFRLVAMCVIAWYLVHLAARHAPKTLLTSLSLILAGAVGNVIDSTFYGVWFGNAPVGSPTPWFHGQVIDMIFVDFWEGFLPSWIPIFGGQYYSTPIFNVADSCIFIGVCIILIFQGRFYSPEAGNRALDEGEDDTQPTATEDTEPEGKTNSSSSTDEVLAKNDSEESATASEAVSEKNEESEQNWYPDPESSDNAPTPQKD